jgi:hypothetical protein
MEQDPVTWIGIEGEANLSLIFGQEFGQSLTLSHHH